jgi:hypothetical protein
MKKLALLFSVISIGLSAQNNTVSAGGDAIGSGGSSSYSVGQIIYHAYGGQDFSLQQGLQQPFEVFVLGTPEKAVQYPKIAVFPNPTENNVYLQTESLIENAKYELYDASARRLYQEKINGLKTTIPMEGFRAGVYFLYVTKGTQAVQSFKIIKN